MRQLVTQRVVRELTPIEGADKIELAKVDGWQCVVKKGQFQTGEKALYFEIDSMIPATDQRFAFLSRGKVVKRYRIKSVKLRGALSQGLLIPISDLTNEERLRIFDGETPTEVLSVEKYEPVIPMGGTQKGTFPTHLVPKTDQERIQNMVSALEGRSSHEFEITEKLDGTSCTFFSYTAEGPILGDQLRTGVCSRNWEMQILDENIYAKQYNKLGIHDKLRGLGGRHIAIQGEIIGPSIQGNKYKLDEQTFYVFDIYDIDEKRYLGSVERCELAEKLGLNHAPLVRESMEFTLDSVLDAADGRSILHDTPREGLVFKGYDGKTNFKAISNKWLLKNE